MAANKQKIDYEYFDFHANCKKSTNMLDHFLREGLRDLYLRDIGLYSDKQTTYFEDGKVYCSDLIL